MIESRRRTAHQRGVSGYYRQGYLVFEVDDNVAKFEERKIRECNIYKKRKFDNALFLENANLKKPIKIFHHG